jgi:serine/threonine protein kinase
MLGRTLGHYRIEEQLGAGGMGVVYKARDTRLDRDVAVKIISPESHNPALEEAFRREARLASSLNHPAIVTILDIVHEGDLACIVMEYLAGQTLNYLIPENGFPVETALELALQIGSGIAAAHAAGIVHRDLKPGNIVVGPTGRIKILDFGLAKLAERSTDSTTRSVSVFGDKVVGTIAYMAPEQARGEQVDQRADIFSFGVIFSQMLTGQLPFRAPNPVALIRAMQVSEPTPVRQVRPELPVSLEAITLRALAKDREERFPTMTEMMRALTQRITPAGWQADDSPPASAAARSRSAPVVSSTTTSSILPPATGTERTSIAVLPFSSVAADPEDGYLASGLASEVIRALTGVPGLRVAPQGASFRLGEQASDPMTVARMLNTRYVVTGTVRRAGPRLRVVVELVDAIEERVAWAQTA